jgi:WD40 repeat protein
MSYATRAVGILLLAALAATADERKPAHDVYGDPLPPGAVARLGTTRLRHASWVNAVAYAPGGKVVASASLDRTVRLWDAASGKQLHVLAGHTEAVIGIAFSPDGKRLASTGIDGTVRLWDVATGRELFRFRPHERSVARSVAFSPDGKVLATGGGAFGHRVLALWDADRGKKLRAFGGKKEMVHVIVFSPDGKRLAAGDKGGAVQLWDPATGRLLPGGWQHLSTVHALAFSPDGQRLVSAGQDSTLRLWDLRAGKKIWDAEEKMDWGPPQGLRVRNTGINAVAFSPDGKTVAWGGHAGPVRLSDAATGKAGRVLGTRQFVIHSLAFNPDGKTLAVGTNEHVLHLWDVKSGKERLTFAAHTGPVNFVACTPDGRRAASVGSDITVRLWDARSSKPLAGFRPHRGYLNAFAFAPDGRSFATGSSDGDIRFWDSAGKQIRRLAASGNVLSLAFSPDGKLLASGNKVESGDHGTVTLWDVKTGKEVRRLLEKTKHGFWGLAFSPDDKLLAAASYDVIHLLDTETWKELRRLPGLPGFSFSPDGNMLLTGNRDNQVRLFDVASGRELRRCGKHGDTLIDFRFSPDGRTLVWAGEGKDVLLVEAATGRLRRRFAGHTGDVRSVAFTPDGRCAVSASEDTTLLVWDLRAVGGGPERREELPNLWADLAGDDAEKAYRAVCRLGSAVPFLRQRLKPAAPVSAEQIARLVRDLGDRRFKVRDRAARELEALEERARPALRAALAGRPGLETRRRLERLLEQLDGPLPAGELLRGLRAVEALEQAGTAEAREVLRLLAGGAPEARLTRDARAALRRLASQ